ncbi:MAG TPA: class I SAM-dependent methyltransferase [Chloroflexia bacterium]|nr:class I SAM-dependent methyltransferase [Chloroflexia bacterium]
MSENLNEYMRSNRDLWNAWTELHEKSSFYDIEGFKAGRSTLHDVEKEELGEVAGKSLLHLQCHFGLDTLSWARLGALVTGVDFSDKSIALARSLSAELRIPAQFVHSNIYDLPGNLSGQFDIVFTSYGVLWWLPDLQSWTKVVTHFLKPGGTFLVVESHPMAMVFDPDDAGELTVAYPYFPVTEPLRFDVKGSYASDSDYRGVEYGWPHSMGELVNAHVAAGLKIVSLREFPFLAWRMFPFMEQGADGWWRLPGRMVQIPLMFSLRAVKGG